MKRKERTGGGVKDSLHDIHINSKEYLLFQKLTSVSIPFLLAMFFCYRIYVLNYRRLLPESNPMSFTWEEFRTSAISSGSLIGVQVVATSLPAAVNFSKRLIRWEPQVYVLHSLILWPCHFVEYWISGQYWTSRMGLLNATAVILLSQAYFGQSLRAQVFGAATCLACASIFIGAYDLAHPEMPSHSVALILLINLSSFIVFFFMIFAVRRMLESLVGSLLTAIRMRERAMDLFLRVVPRHVGKQIIREETAEEATTGEADGVDAASTQTTNSASPAEPQLRSSGPGSPPPATAAPSLPEGGSGEGARPPLVRQGSRAALTRSARSAKLPGVGAALIAPGPGSRAVPRGKSAAKEGSASAATLANIEDREEVCTVLFGKLEFPRDIKRCGSLPEAETSLRLMTAVIDRVDEVLRQARRSPLFDFFDKTRVRGRCDLTKVESQPGLFIVMAGHNAEANWNHELWCAAAALAIREAIEADFPQVSVRMGITTGPLTGALLGETGLVYSVYGDTVNVAARLASLCGKPGSPFQEARIALSAATMRGLWEKGSNSAFVIRQEEGIAIKGKEGGHLVGSLESLSHIGHVALEGTSSGDLVPLNGGMSARSRGSFALSTINNVSEGKIDTGRASLYSRMTRGSMTSRSRARIAGEEDADADAAEGGATGVSSQDLTREVRRTMKSWIAEINILTLCFKDDAKEHRYVRYAAVSNETQVKVLCSGSSLTIVLSCLYGFLGLTEDAVRLGRDGLLQATESEPWRDGVGIGVLIAALFSSVLSLAFLLHPRRIPLAATRWGPRAVVGLSLCSSFLMAAYCHLSRADWIMYFAFVGPYSFIMLSGILPFWTICIVTSSWIGSVLASMILWMYGTRDTPGLRSNNDLFLFHSAEEMVSFGLLVGGVTAIIVARLYTIEARQRMGFAVEERVAKAMARFTSLVHQSLPKHIVPRVLASEKVAEVKAIIARSGAHPNALGSTRAGGFGSGSGRGVTGAIGGRNEAAEALRAAVSMSSSNTPAVLAPVVAEHFPGAAVFFLDLVSFTGLASNVETHGVLIQSLRLLLTELDGLTTRHRILKLFTIGDAYIAFTDPAAARDGEGQKVRDVLDFARAALDAVARVSDVMGTSLSGPLECRIGIAFGPLSCGILGTAMPLYRGFGAALEQANEMESRGTRGRIHCTSAVHKIVSGSPHLFDGFKFEVCFEEKNAQRIEDREVLPTYLIK